jgi:hypothetical protein
VAPGWQGVKLHTVFVGQVVHAPPGEGTYWPALQAVMVVRPVVAIATVFLKPTWRQFLLV